MECYLNLYAVDGEDKSTILSLINNILTQPSAEEIKNAINNRIDFYNIKSKFYLDDCSTYTSIYGIDLCYKDRYKYIYI